MNFIQSMTGFGRSEKIDKDQRILVEIRSVNHKYLDISIKMPRRFNFFESNLRKLIKSQLERGKIDVYIDYEDFGLEGRRLIYNSSVARGYVESINKIASDFELKNTLTAYQLSSLPDVLMMEEDSKDERFLSVLEEAVREAIQNLLIERRREGEHLRDDLLMKLDRMDAYVLIIESLSPSISEEYQERLLNKIRETLGTLGQSIDEARILTEVAIFADRVSTDEEMVRLKSHISAAREKLFKGGSQGRTLDFIAQEMMREANTTLSKSNNFKKSDLSIALKTEIEKIREQVQNIE